MKDVTDSVKAATTKKGAKKALTRRWRTSLYILFTVAIAFYYYIVLPPIHYASMQFWTFLFIICAGLVIIKLISDGIQAITLRELPQFNWSYKLLVLPWFVLGLIFILGQFIFSPLFFAKQYAGMIDVQMVDFSTDFGETNTKEIPLIDRDTAIRLGNRKIGALSHLVSQFEAASDYTQVNVRNHPFRVTPLEYAGFFKWLNNFQEGIPNYLKVDMVTGDVTVETPKQVIRYSDADMFDRDVTRHLRFNYPFALFDKPSFEIDDEGNPYYIASTYGRNFFLSEPEVTGLITLNAITGETTRYALADIPTWVDRVYGAELILHQLKMNGEYKNGFWNSLFAKEGVTMPTEGYNYLPLNDDMYLYTGITSVAADESNIGFVLVNMRTKEARMFPVTAAEEFSAMESAEGSVQEKGYKATFPLLINIKGNPMYILSLKDSSGLIKSYALIDVQNYQRVYIDSNVDRLIQQYVNDNQLTLNEEEITEETLVVFAGKIEQIQATVVDGNTVYYFMLDGKVYRAPIQLSEQLPFVKEGQQVEFKATEDGVVRELEVEE
ncbi:hypothetical protein NHG33_08440 [Aerococcaceae bacterium NML130460]|nr:hypothetical protein [Aerococcaceae bacterium NML130460]